MQLNAEVYGVEETIAAIERRIGPAAMSKIIDRALREGARTIKSEIVSQFQSFRDTGASINEIVISKPMTLNGARTVVIHWRGPKNRYSIIHLNEHGTIKNPNPRGKGAIERALRAGRQKYFDTIAAQVRRAVS